MADPQAEKSKKLELWKKMLFAVLATSGVFSMVACPLHGWGSYVFGFGGILTVVVAAVLGCHWF